MSFEDIPVDPSLADPLPPSPLALVGRWLEDALEQGAENVASAMTLATLRPDGTPAARVMLCRGYDPEAGYVVFYTNRQSSKGRDLGHLPRAAGVFHWGPLVRQIRVEGPVIESPIEESDGYFAGRPRLAQIAAWASNQSEPVASRDALLERLAEQERRFGGSQGDPLPRPPHWGGYRLFFERVELWVGSMGRAHDRALWVRKLQPTADGFEGSDWAVTRLQP
jgi:pyridoxamine 5'-phosphate oxidase